MKYIALPNPNITINQQEKCFRKKADDKVPLQIFKEEKGM